mgnify:CR=1 FL=1
MADDVPQLDATQQRIVETYLGMEQGLAVFASVPGSGKSTASSKAAAKDMLARAADGDPRPHERVLIASFSQADAADLVPDIVAWVEELYERGDAPAALDRSDIDRLITQVRDAPRIGTIDSFLRTVCAAIATEMGFDSMPTVGNDALIEQLHQDAYAAVQADNAGNQCIERIQAAYDDVPGAMSVSELLREALAITRRRGLTPDEVTTQLTAAISENYRGGSVSSLEDVLAAVSTYREPSTAATIRETLTDTEAAAVVEADERLRNAWLRLAETVGTLLEQYTTAYDARSRSRGVMTHTDCAWLVETYFSDPQYASPRRHRLKTRYQANIESVIIDEAQDVSQIQHDVMTHLVGDDVRLLLAGDREQCLYEWRDATPALFAGALEDGEYFGRTWTPHATEQTEQNYRARPALVRFVNAVAERGLGDEHRGGVNTGATAPPTLTARRTATADPSLHVATFTPHGGPGTDDWVAPKQGHGAATTLARYVASGIANGTLPAADGDAGITVLFPRRNQMETYASAFEARGLTVADASAYLFDAPAVRAVIDVLKWLGAPHDSGRTQWLLTESTLAAVDGTHPDAGEGLHAVSAAVRETAGACDQLDRTAHTAGQARVLSGLARLRDDRQRRHATPASVVVRDIIDHLNLEGDPLGIDPATSDPQRVATLDAFIGVVEDWEGDDQYSASQLHQLLTPFVETPQRGPTQPVVDADAVDVVFRTVHDMKGDQDDVIVLADVAWSKLSWATGMQTLVTSADGVALAPPADVLTPAQPALPGVDGGLYEPAPDSAAADRSGGHGLRWDAEHWLTDSSGHTALRGPPVRRAAAAATRAEWWRTLHVALSRAQEHLIFPLPRSEGSLSTRDHWAQVLYEVCGADSVTNRGTHTVALPDGDGVLQPTQVAVDRGELDPVVTQTRAPATGGPPQRPQRSPPATDIVGAEWQPRFVRPSLLGPLADAPAAHLVSILREQTVHTETDPVDPDLPLTFATVGSEAVGDIVHMLVARLVRAEVPAEALCGPAAREIAADVLTQQVDGRVETDEWAGLHRFLVKHVLPDLAASALWRRVERASTAYIEEPLTVVTRVDGVDIEVQGAADIVLVMPDGTRHIEELKVQLAPATDALRRRYRRQAQVYQWVLAQQVAPTVSVAARVTTVGAVAESYAARSPAGLRELLTQEG